MCDSRRRMQICKNAKMQIRKRCKYDKNAICSWNSSKIHNEVTIVAMSLKYVVFEVWLKSAFVLLHRVNFLSVSIISSVRALLSSSFTSGPLIQDRNRAGFRFISWPVSANMGRIRSHSPRLVAAATDEGQGSVPLLCQSPDIARSSILVIPPPLPRLENGLADNNGAHCSYTDTLTMVVLTPEMLVWSWANKTGGFGA